MKIPIEIFSRVLHVSCDGVCIFHYNLEDFEYPENESPFTASRLLHNDDDPALVKNKEVKYYTHMAQE